MLRNLQGFQRVLHAPSVLNSFRINTNRIASSWFHTSSSIHIVPRTTHYAVLGVGESASAQEIKTAYYDLSKRWHPDRNRNSGTTDEAHKMFLKISEAYSVLGAEQSRRDYDRTLLRSGGGPNRRAGLHTSRSSVHRYASSSAFSSSGEYSSAKRSDNTTGYRRPNSTYTRYAGTGGTFVKSNFEEWERKHYWELKQSAQHIDGHVRESAKQNKYSNWQISIYQLWEALTVFTIVFAVGWGGRYFIYYSAGTNGSETVVVRNGQKPSHKDE